MVGSGCGAWEGEKLVSGPRLVEEVQAELDIPLSEAPRLETTSVMADVDQTYVGRSRNERILVVIFGSTAATVQLTERRRAGDDVDALVRDNAVILYEHEHGSVSRLGRIKVAVERAARDG